MNLLFLSSSFPSPQNAARGTFNLSLMRALAVEHDVRVVSPVSWVDELSARLRGRGPLTKSLSFGPRLEAVYPRFYYPPKLLRSQYGRFLWWSIRGVVQSEIDRQKPDAIISYWAHPDGEAAVRAARAAGVPVIAMVGGSDVLLLARSGSRRQAILRVLHNSDAVVPVSRNLEDTLLKDGIPASKLEVIPRGVDRTVFFPDDRREARRRLGLNEERPLLVAVGRLVPVKGFDTLIDACATLKQRIPNVQCCLLGSGPLEKKLRSQIQSLGLEGTVELRGSKKQKELADWYRAASLTVLTSHSEGIPNVLLESLACGTPFVATRVGGIPDIADERFHTLVPPANPTALAAAVAERLLNPVPANATPRFLPSTWEDAATRLTEVINRCRTDNPVCPARSSARDGQDCPSCSGEAVRS